MTAQLMSRERLEEIRDYDTCVTLEESAELARMALAAMDSEPVAWQIHTPETGVTYVETNSQSVENIRNGFGIKVEITPLYRHAQLAPDDYFSSLVSAARLQADKAMRKYPQPNYVLNKVAEESGEVIKAVIHYHEGREEWARVEAELIDNLAMLIRLVVEGDQVIGFTPPEVCRAGMLKAGNSPVIPDGYVIVPKEPTEEMNKAGWSAMNKHDAINPTYRAMLAAAPQSPGSEPATVPGKWIPVSERKPDCWCLTCRPMVLNDTRFVVCPDCGNKRCPRANDHRNVCTWSNEPGQEGSAYQNTPQEEKP